MVFDKNFEEMTDFLEGTRRRLLKVNKGSVWIARRGKRHGPSIAGYVDFSKIEEMSTAAALVLAAEYQRAIDIIKSPPPLVNIRNWKDEVLLQLYQLGFFSILGITDDALAGQLYTQGDVMTLKILSGSNALETEQADQMLMELGRFLDPENQLPNNIRIPLNSALSEAMVNVRKHAYPEDYDFQYRHLGRWWLAASANRREKSLTVVIYDQGATIPVTYSKMATLDHVRKFIDQIVAPGQKQPFAYDGVHIEAAAKFGNSQTGQSHRGKGLPDMLHVIDQCQDGRLVILSRGGRYVYNAGGRSSRSSYHRSVGGTLIEWNVRLPDDGPGDRND
ncbi:hypothetical protein [Rhizobium sp. H4]|uniref:hypothetical protein n=1 Tax=Rhizobium sp. H4 TaxID=2035449 RepID=UPI0011432262|nr:hypothetical protein [Rhizobium sp. H4]